MCWTDEFCLFRAEKAVVFTIPLFLLSTLSDEHLVEKTHGGWVFTSVIFWGSHWAPEFCVTWIWKNIWSLKQCKCPTGKTIDKLPIETTEHDSAIKRKEQVIQAMVLVNLKNIILSERSRHKRTHLAWFLLYKVLEQAKLLSSYRNQNMVSSYRVWRLTRKRMRELSGEMGKVFCLGQLLHSCIHLSRIIKLNISELFYFVVC